MSNKNKNQEQKFTIDCTPRWVDIINLIAARATEGNAICREELARAATLADHCGAVIKQRDELRAKLELCEAVLGANPTHCNQETGEAVSELLKGVREAIRSSK